jgi:hypothetical protein
MATTDELRTHAEAFRIGLDVGAASVDDVVRWAQEVVTETEHPHWSLCELATCGHLYPPDLRPHLQAVPGVLDPKRGRALVLGMLAQTLSAYPERADQVARALFELASGNEIEEAELRKLAWWAWDALTLADAGYITQTRDQIIAQVSIRLNAAADDEPG